MRHLSVSKQKGLQAIEFALILPILLILLFGVVEFGRYIVASQKANKLAHTVANLTAQLGAITCDGVREVTSPPVTFNIMYLFEFKPVDGIVISAVNNVNGNQQVVFQFTRGTVLPPAIGAVGDAPNFAAFGGYTLQPNEGVIVTEVTYRYLPIFFPNDLLDALPGRSNMWHFGLWRPRGGALVRLNPANLTACP